ncbi:MAG: 4Fe-4S dicluster domain-containing protein [Candidatus Diapherotrites archaeon]|nr:4Fe-4S dicluster domain-containing protein [Candidatus Diapherotrites archaeon]
MGMAGELFKQMFKKSATNQFPVKYAPKSTTKLLEKVEKGEAKINPPVPTPPNFRGRLSYLREKCILCRQCIRVCPAAALEFDQPANAIKHYVARCTFCAQCVDICPTKCLAMTDEFLLSAYDTNMGFAIPKKEEKKEEEPKQESEKPIVAEKPSKKPKKKAKRKK